MATEGHPLSGAKWCPECGTLNAFDNKECAKRGCKYLFTDEETSGWRLRQVETPVAALTDAEIPGRLASLTQQPPEEPLSRAEDRRVLMQQLVWVGISAGSGLFIALIGYWIATDRAGETRGSFWTGFMVLVGILGIVAAIVGLVRSLLWYFNPPKFEKAPQVAKCFYNELLGDDPGSFSRAWSCLDAQAKARFGSLEEFRSYWSGAKDRMQKWAADAAKDVLDRRPAGYQHGTPKYRVDIETPKLEPRATNAADLIGEIVITLYDQVEAGKNASGQPTYAYVYHGRYVWPQRKTILMGPDRWYLTSGTVDGPPGWETA